MDRLSSVYRLLLCCCLFTGVSAETTTMTSSATSSSATTSSSTEVSQVPYCNNITAERFQLRSDVNACRLNKSDPILGNREKPVTLDFSYADPGTLNIFLSQFTQISGSVEMKGNKDVVSMGFHTIKVWHRTRGATFRIFNNPQLKNIIWSHDVEKFTIHHEKDCDKKVLLVYNNPLLDMNKVPLLLEVAENCKYLSKELNECMFQDVLTPQIYHSPSEELLKNCQKIRGDLILENMAVRTKKLEVCGPACLRLINTEMNGVVFEVTNKTKDGQAKCSDGSKSEIRDNKHLCHPELQKIYEYLDADNNGVIIDPDASCAQECKKQADIDAKFMMCNVITGDVDISSWFTDSPLPRYKWKNLEKIQATVIISSASIMEISLLAVTKIQHLKIIDNPSLTKINLPANVAIDELTITGNAKLTPSNLGIISKLEKTPKKSTIECHLHNTTVISDIYDLGPCTATKGQLTLKGLRYQPEEDALKGKIIEGCVRVEETEINNVEFLKRAVFPSCKGFHIFKNNPELCPLRTLHNESVTTVGAKIKGCGKVCKSLAEKKCAVLEGSLTITDSTPVADLSELVTINGNVNIIGTNFKNLSFPKLEIIKSDKAPALNIRNNKKLEWISMQKIVTISADDGGKPVVEIVNNYRLENQHFLTQKLESSCSDKKTSSCYLIYNDRSGDGIPLYGWLIIVAIILHLSVIAFVVVWKILNPDHVENPEQPAKVEKKQRSPTNTPNLGSKSPAIIVVPSAETAPMTPTKGSTEGTPLKPSAEAKYKSPAGRTPEKSKETTPVTPTKGSTEGTPLKPSAYKSPAGKTPEKSKETTPTKGSTEGTPLKPSASKSPAVKTPVKSNESAEHETKNR